MQVVAGNHGACYKPEGERAEGTLQGDKTSCVLIRTHKARSGY